MVDCPRHRPKYLTPRDEFPAAVRWVLLGLTAVLMGLAGWFLWMLVKAL